MNRIENKIQKRKKNPILGFFSTLEKLLQGKTKKNLLSKLENYKQKKKTIFGGFYESGITFENFEKNYKLLQVGDNSKIN